MAEILKGLFGGSKPAQTPLAAAPAGDDGFADFAGAPDPSPASIIASVSSVSPNAASSLPTSQPLISYTKWYRVWERTSISDFYNEMIIFPFIVAVVITYIWGTRKNRSKAKGWIQAHAPVLENEYASVGFGGRRSPEGAQGVGGEDYQVEDGVLKENGPTEFVTYATGRSNVAFLDIKLTLLKRYNPILLIGETVTGFFFDSMPATIERMEATAYAFDGQESKLVPASKDESRKSAGNSTYDGFVWAIVNKDMMAQLRQDRYDISLTTTKDHPKLPAWATVMSESSEVTDALLAPELIKAVNDCGDLLDALVITDQPVDRPKKLNETVPRKRITLSIRLPSSTSASAYKSSLPLFTYYLRLPDFLTSNARFRPEVTRRIRATREEEIRKIKKVDDDEKSEERKLQSDKEKKQKRDNLLKGLGSVEQKKFLEKEREKEQRRSQKKRTQKA
ncbi:DUF1682-domain-containing protein [Tothia fuscella]|uniref:DUF1682-domain-containing protein n=1 Tax=Tothia fuscella TaxID=1048955 RepID=A0A9P4NUG6_9PEZI|nr:DUF1682-domain-containing protein [Tothia fuscella]